MIFEPEGALLRRKCGVQGELIEGESERRRQIHMLLADKN